MLAVLKPLKAMTLSRIRKIFPELSKLEVKQFLREERDKRNIIYMEDYSSREVITDPEWFFTFVGEVLFRMKTCQGENCYMCLLYQDVWKDYSLKCHFKSTIDKDVIEKCINYGINTMIEHEIQYSIKTNINTKYQEGLLDTSLMYLIFKAYTKHFEMIPFKKDGRSYWFDIISTIICSSNVGSTAIGNDGELYNFIPALVMNQVDSNIPSKIDSEENLVIKIEGSNIPCFGIRTLNSFLICLNHMSREDGMIVVIKEESVFLRYYEHGCWITLNQNGSHHCTVTVSSKANVDQYWMFHNVGIICHHLQENISEVKCVTLSWKPPCPQCSLEIPTTEDLYTLQHGCEVHRYKPVEVPFCNLLGRKEKKEEI
jgi:hypothetical protein